ncbi:MAG: four helix bundle protein [Myxococcales bacterium]|nr:four helix bundle protein [Myxococcales bacterium]
MLRSACPGGTADLQDQLRRAARSIAQNIAEGVGKTTGPDKAKFFAIVRGSAMECVAHLRRVARGRHRGPGRP